MLDAITCALIERRFRYLPARNRDGTPVLSTVQEDHHWVVQANDAEQPHD